MSSIVSIFFVLFLWWFLTGVILYTAKRLDLGDSKTRFTVVLVTFPLFLCACLLYTSDAADDSLRVDLGGRRII